MNKLTITVITALCVFMASCSVSKNSQQIIERKFPADQLKSDFILLKKILEANHPSLYWYTSKDSLDFYFNTSINSINDSLTEPQFRNKVAWVISKIRCGHTSVSHSKAYSKAIRKVRSPQFPLAIKTWDDSLVVLRNLLREDTLIERGTIITSINGMRPAQLLDSMFQLVSTDGYSNNFKSQLVSFNFPMSYKNTFGLSKKYKIGYVDSDGIEKFSFLPNYDFSKDSLAKETGTRPQAPKPTRKQRRRAALAYKRSIELDTVHRTAYMRIATFSSSGLRLFFRSSFKKMEQQDIRHLVIDLRENGGGKMNVSNVLVRYLIDHPFANADTVAAISRSFKYSRHIQSSLIYWVSMHVITKRERDGRYHFRYFENHLFQPKKRFHYKGKVTFLQGGYSFSASCMVLSALKGQNNVTLAGEETGGGSYGNSSVHLPTIVLPNSGCRIVLPMFRVVFDAEKPKNGRGVMPDIFIPPSSSAIRKGIDIKLEKVKELIQEAEATGSKLP